MSDDKIPDADGVAEIHMVNEDGGVTMTHWTALSVGGASMTMTGNATIIVRGVAQGVGCNLCEADIPHRHLPAVVEDVAEEAEYGTLQEAIDAAVAQSKDGDEITVHEADCTVDDDGDLCTCTPLTITVSKGTA